MIGSSPDYAVEAKYPNDYDLYCIPSVDETKNAITLSKAVVNSVQEKIGIDLSPLNEGSGPEQDSDVPKSDVFVKDSQNNGW